MLKRVKRCLRELYRDQFFYQNEKKRIYLDFSLVSTYISVQIYIMHFFVLYAFIVSSLSSPSESLSHIKVEILLESSFIFCFILKNLYCLHKIHIFNGSNWSYLPICFCSGQTRDWGYFFSYVLAETHCVCVCVCARGGGGG